MSHLEAYSLGPYFKMEDFICLQAKKLINLEQQSPVFLAPSTSWESLELQGDPTSPS